MRRLIANVKQFWPPICAAIATLGSLALLWYVRDMPLELGATVRFDALSAFFCLLVSSGLTLALARGPSPALAIRHAAAALVLLLAFGTTLTPAVAIGYLVVGLLVRETPPPEAPAAPLFSRTALLALSRRAIARLHWPLAGVCVLLAYGALVLRGALQYTDIGAGAALDGFVFWFALLAAALPVVPFRARQANLVPAPAWLGKPALMLAWAYPLARLYSLGPWNTGWALATLLLAGGIAGWSSLSALVEPDRQLRLARLLAASFALALAALGLGTSAGIAAACFGMLATLVLGAGLISAEAREPRAQAGASYDAAATLAEHPTGISLIGWLLAGIFPFSTPFVAAWMLIGAGVTAGVPLLAGVAWMVALLNGLTIALWGFGKPPVGRAAAVIAGLSVALGVGAPLIVRGLVQPVVAQLQGGLTSYGDVAIWPWVGLAATDAANVQVTTLPSIAIAALMLVLAALVYVVARLRETYILPQEAPPADGETPAARSAGLRGELLRNLRDDVPWLGMLLGSDNQPEEAPRERE